MNEKQKTERNKKVALIAPYKGNSKPQKSSSVEYKGNTTGTELSENEKLKVRAERFKAHLNTETAETTKERYTKSHTSFTTTVKTGFSPSKQPRKHHRGGLQTQTRRRREERCENVLSKVEERIRRRKERSAIPPENLLIKVTVRTQKEGYIPQDRDDYDDPVDNPYQDNPQLSHNEDWPANSPLVDREDYESDQSVGYIDSPRSNTSSEWSNPTFELNPFGETMVRQPDSDRGLKGSRFEEQFDKDAEFHSDLYEERARTPERFHKRLDPRRGVSERFGSTEDFMDETDLHKKRSRDLTPERFRNRLDNSDRERVHTPERLRKRMDSPIRRSERTETTVYHRERSETTVRRKERVRMSVGHRDRIESPKWLRARRRSPRGRDRSGRSDSSRDRSPEYSRDSTSSRERDRRSRRGGFARDLPTPPRGQGQPEGHNSERTPEKVKVNQSSSKQFRGEMIGSYSFRRRMSYPERTDSRKLSKKGEKQQPVVRCDKYQEDEPIFSLCPSRQPALQPTGPSRIANLQEKYDPMEPTKEDLRGYEDHFLTRRLPSPGRPLRNSACDQDYRTMPVSMQRNRFQEIGVDAVRDREPIKQPSPSLPPNTFDYGHGLKRTPSQISPEARFDKTNFGGKTFSTSPQVLRSEPLRNQISEGGKQWLVPQLQQTSGSRNDPLNLYSIPNTTGSNGSIPLYKADILPERGPYRLDRPSASIQYPGNLGTRSWSNGQGLRGQPDRYSGPRLSPNPRGIDGTLERSNVDHSFEERGRSRTRPLRQSRFDRSRSRSRSEERERRGTLRDRPDVQQYLLRYQPRERGKY